MKEFIQPILDLIQNLIQPEQGTKFLITVAGLGAIYFLHANALSTTVTDIVIGCMVVAYYLADIVHKGPKQGGGK